MKYRIELSGRGGEAVIGKVKREFYDLFEGEDSELDLEDYVWNFDYFEENEDADIPEDIRPFYPGEWSECDDVAHEFGVSIDSLYLTLTQGDDVILDNVETDALNEMGVTFESNEEFFTDELLDEGETFITVQTYEKGFFFSYEFEAESFDPNKLTFYVSDVNGWELVTSASYDNQELEDLGELSTTGKGSDVWLNIVEKD